MAGTPTTGKKLTFIDGSQETREGSITPHWRKRPLVHETRKHKRTLALVSDWLGRQPQEKILKINNKAPVVFQIVAHRIMKMY